MRCYTSPGRTSLDGRLRSWGLMYIYISLCFSFSSNPRASRAFQSTRPACRSITHHRTYNLSIAPLRNLSSCAAALTITSWVARLSAPQTTTSSSHFSFCPSAHHTVFLPCMEPMRLISDHSLPDGPSQAGSRQMLYPALEFRFLFLFSHSKAWDWASARQS